MFNANSWDLIRTESLQFFSHIEQLIEAMIIDKKKYIGQGLEPQILGYEG